MLPTKILRAAALGTTLAVTGLAATTVLSTVALATEETNVTDGFAVQGYDVVAYFTEGKPVQGRSAYRSTHDGATYRFASAGNKALFDADPAAYVPQYGGWCAFGAAMGRKFPIVPDAWRIVDGKLYLNNSKKVQQRWNGDVPGFIRGADNNWKIIRSVADADLAQTRLDGVTLGAQ